MPLAAVCLALGVGKACGGIGAEFEAVSEGVGAFFNIFVIEM